MDTILAVQGKGFILMAADTAHARSIVVMKSDEDKIMELDTHKLLAHAGEAGDGAQFVDFVQKNINWQNLRSGVPLSTHAAAHFTRHQLATALRKNPYNVNILLGGYSEKEGASLYYMDYLASMHKVKYGAHGYSSFFVLSIMDKEYKEDMSLEEAQQLLEHCFAEIGVRFMVNSSKFILKVVDADGTRTVPRAGAAANAQATA